MVALSKSCSQLCRECLKIFWKGKDLNSKDIKKKVYFQIQKWPYATLNELWGQSSSYEKFVSL